MERPSHLLIDTHASVVRRGLLLAAALSLQVAGAWLFTHGLARSVIDVIRDIELTPMHEIEKPRTPPPPDPVMTRVEPPKTPFPTFDVGPAREAGNSITTVTAGSPPATTTGSTAGAATIKPPVSVAGTHTVPPYPPAARRLGIEGTVTLRLTVGLDGRVSEAQIVTSSGREDLDEAAQAWIVSHWRYRAALKEGVPVASQATAKVLFSLKDEH